MFFRSILVALSVLTIAAPAAATCPTVLTDELLDSWGEPTAQGFKVDLYEPRALRMLGHSVSYVVLDEDRAKLYFRLSGENRSTGEPLSSQIRNVFRQAYPSMTCDEFQMSCDGNVEYSTEDFHLNNVDLMDENLPFADWHGSGAAKIGADEEIGAVYLICSYEN